MVGLIICGALAHEVVDMIKEHGWDAEVAAVPASVHIFPIKSPPALKNESPS